jgi:hypothetical protein
MFGPSPPAFSIGNSRRDTAPTTAEIANPGPASYNLAKDLTDGKMTSFPRAKRYRPSTYAGPGPGSYESRANLKKAPQAIVISRKAQSKVDIIPGPADYSPRKLEKNISYSMRSKSASRSAKDLPGPGSYDPANVKQAPPRAT